MNQLTALYRRLLSPLENIFDWSPITRTMLLMGYLLIIQAHYAAYVLYFIFKPSLYLNGSVLHLVGLFIGGLGTITAALIWLGYHYRNSPRLSPWIPQVYILYYCLVLVFFGYIAGLLFISTGIVLASAPIVGLILLERKMIYQALVFASSLLSIVSLLTFFGLLRHAPLFTPLIWLQNDGLIFLSLSLFYFAFPHLAVSFILADICLDRWRQRENLIYHISMTDTLTGLKNRYAIERVLQEFLSAPEFVLPLSVVLVDIDFFKSVNDNYGHLVGDRALQEAGRIFKMTLRKSDHIGRYGGEEFLMVLQNTRELDAAAIAERCRRMLEHTRFSGDNGERISLTASFGIYCSFDGSEGMESIILRADRNLYNAKQAGRNRIWHDNTVAMPTIADPDSRTSS